MKKDKLFTKSAFKVALECPWKLYYYRNPEIFTNNNADDDFLAALAEGGFQVGELAKIYCCVDEDLKGETDNEKALERTEELMKRENVTIAEAAFRWNDMFVRVDILKKRGNILELIEVKAKSWNPEIDTFVSNRSKLTVKSAIKSYVYDVAFQKYVVSNAMPDYKVKGYLMMADKSKVADVNGLNQLFKISKNSQGRSEVSVNPKAKDILAKSDVELVFPFDVDSICDDIIAGKSAEQSDPNYMLGMGFKDFVTKASDCYVNNKPFSDKPALCGTCFGCEFCDYEDRGRSGKHKCWATRVSVKDFESRPLIERLNGSDLGSKRNEWVRNGKSFLDEVSEEMIRPKDDKKNYKPGLKNYERKLLQIGLETNNEKMLEPFKDCLHGHTYIDVDGLKEEMKTWIYPLHMIDFETTAMALPYYKGLRPYEQVAFQFSHHIIRKDGAIEHIGQYLNEDVTKFPNFEFVRELKKQLEKDNGTIFRYANHENSILRTIANQLEESKESDKNELISFIDTITHCKVDGKTIYGDRDMVDLLDIVKRYFYNLDEMHGSNSIKKVLPAVLNSSQHLKDRYSKPIYGSEIPSKNISAEEPLAWIKFEEDGHIDSPYHQLASVGELIGLSDDEIAMMEIEEDDEFTVANGGAALTAYNKLLFCQDQDGENLKSGALREALLRYCELDTMSMVFIWEYFNHECNK